MLHVNESSGTGRSMQSNAVQASDVYFSADVETDGPIPGPYSMLSFALVLAGRFDGRTFTRPAQDDHFYQELKPISDAFEEEALAVNRLDRARLLVEGSTPAEAMSAAARWVRQVAGPATPVLVAYPLAFDWAWLYWYFVRFSDSGSPFNHSRCYDLKTAFAVKGNRLVSRAGRDELPQELRPALAHTHHALEDAREQAEIFARIFEWGGDEGQRVPR